MIWMLDKKSNERFWRSHKKGQLITELPENLEEKKNDGERVVSTYVLLQPKNALTSEYSVCIA